MGIKFILATANEGKIGEMREILSALGIDVTTRGEMGIDLDVEETGSTFMENALLKARAICRASGLPAIADDSGLMVDALGGAPGVYTSSYGAEDLDGAGRNAYLLNNMQNIEQRGATFVSTIVCAFPDGGVLSAVGKCRGEIAEAPRGVNGFGYDPVFYIRELGKTMAELSNDDKNAISHRGAALREFARLLNERRLERGIGL